MDEMHIYEIATIPEGRKAIGNHWVLEFTEDNKGGSVYKVHLVTQGFSQIPGIDYGTTFAPVLKTASLQLIAALVCKHDWELYSFNATRTFVGEYLKRRYTYVNPRGLNRETGGYRSGGCFAQSTD